MLGELRSPILSASYWELVTDQAARLVVEKDSEIYEICIPM
jgi:hypothetical protein